MSAFLRRHWRTLLGGALGALAGGLYAHFIGCRTGTCALTSNVGSASLFFGLTGAIALSPPKEEADPRPAPRDPA